MTTKTITHGDPEDKKTVFEVTVGEATVLQGMKRQMLQSESLTFLPEKKGKRQVPDAPEQLGLYLLRRYTWPNCIACTIASSKAVHHEELTFEQFCQLPEQFVADWENAALEKNPHWRLRSMEEEEDQEEKKGEPASSNE